MMNWKRTQNSLSGRKVQTFVNNSFKSTLPSEIDINLLKDTFYFKCLSALLKIDDLSFDILLAPTRYKFSMLSAQMGIDLKSEITSKELEQVDRVSIKGVMLNISLTLTEAVSYFIIIATNYLFCTFIVPLPVTHNVWASAKNIISILNSSLKLLLSKAINLQDIHKIIIQEILLKLERFPEEGTPNPIYEDISLIRDVSERLENNLIHLVFMGLSDIRNLTSVLLQSLVSVASNTSVSALILLQVASIIQTYIKILIDLNNDIATAKRVIDLLNLNNNKNDKLKENRLDIENEEKKEKIWLASLLSDRIDSRGTSKRGTVEQVIRTITEDSSSKLFKTVIATYQTFMTSRDLLTGLLLRLSPPKNVVEDARSKLIRMRTSVVLKFWIKYQFSDFDQDVISQLKQICENMLLVETTSDVAKAILTTIEQSIEASAHISWLPEIEILVPFNITTPLDIILSITPEEIARQLTLISFKNFKKIEASELLNQSWSRPKLMYNSPNVIRVIKRTDKVSFWVSTTILLGGQEIKKRVEILRKFIYVAQYLHKLQDFNTLMGVIVGLSSSSIYRLKQTWALLDDNEIKLYKSYESLMSPQNSFHAYREHVCNVTPPCVPFLSVYLSDLSIIDESNTDTIENLINIDKRKMIFEIISKLQLYQNESYTQIKRLEPLASYLEVLPLFEEREQYKTSLWDETKSEGIEIDDKKIKEKKKDKNKLDKEKDKSVLSSPFKASLKEGLRITRRTTITRGKKKDKVNDEEASYRDTNDSMEDDSTSNNNTSTLLSLSNTTFGALLTVEDLYQSFDIYLQTEHPGFELHLYFYKQVKGLKSIEIENRKKEAENIYKKFIEVPNAICTYEEKRRLEEALSAEEYKYEIFTEIISNVETKLEGIFNEFQKKKLTKAKPKNKYKGAFKITTKMEK